MTGRLGWGSLGAPLGGGGGVFRGILQGASQPTAHALAGQCLPALSNMHSQSLPQLNIRAGGQHMEEWGALREAWGAWRVGVGPGGSSPSTAQLGSFPLGSRLPARCPLALPFVR